MLLKLTPKSFIKRSKCAGCIRVCRLSKNRGGSGRLIVNGLTKGTCGCTTAKRAGASTKRAKRSRRLHAECRCVGIIIGGAKST